MRLVRSIPRIIAGFLLLGSCAKESTESSCLEAGRLVPSDFAENSRQFNAVCFPEAWDYLATEGKSGPGIEVALIDSGFLPYEDSTYDPRLGPSFDVNGQQDRPDGALAGGLFGPTIHGTTVHSLFASITDNSKGHDVAGACGPWDTAGEQPRFTPRVNPVRLASSGLGDDVGAMREAFAGFIKQRPAIRVVAITKDLAGGSETDDGYRSLGDEFRRADSNQTVLVLAAGNDGAVLSDGIWMNSFDNAVIVGALDADGVDVWAGNDGTSRSGDAIDIYAPGADLLAYAGSSEGSVISGTSAATPLVACVATQMVHAADDNLDAWIVREILAQTADLINTEVGVVPRLNAYAAIRCATDVIRRRPSDGSGHGWSCVSLNNGTIGGFRPLQSIEFN